MFEQFWHFFELLLAKKHVSKRHIVQLYFTPSKRFLLKSHEVRSTQQIQKKARQNCKTLCFSVFCKLASLRTCASHFSFCDSISSSIALNALLVAASHVSRHPDMRLTHKYGWKHPGVREEGPGCSNAWDDLQQGIEWVQCDKFVDICFVVFVVCFFTSLSIVNAWFFLVTHCMTCAARMSWSLNKASVERSSSCWWKVKSVFFGWKP